MAVKVLITGASGFIGQRLVKALCASGEKPRCLLRRPLLLPPGAETV